MQENETVIKENDTTAEEIVDKTAEDNTKETQTEETASKLEEAEQEVEQQDESEHEIKKESKKGFKKKKDKKDEKIEELNEKLIRTIAEFDNFRKRTEKEKSQMFEIGARDIIEKILPIIDNFERGLGSVPEGEKDSLFVQGIEQIYKQLMTALESAGVTPIEAVGKEFDPNFHNAVMHAEDENYGENIVSEELQKGYMYRETVVRYSMVKVVN